MNSFLALIYTYIIFKRCNSKTYGLHNKIKLNIFHIKMTPLKFHDAISIDIWV